MQTPEDCIHADFSTLCIHANFSALCVQADPLTLCIHAGAVFMAGEQYGDEVRVIDIPGVSMELCGGTHVTRTGQIGVFKILSEGGIASGVRRVEAVAGPAAVDHMNTLDSVVRAIGQQLKAKNEELPARVTGVFFAYAGWVIEIQQSCCLHHTSQRLIQKFRHFG